MSGGTFDKAKGNVKEAAGDLSGNQNLKDEGKVDKAAGSIKNAVNDAASKVKDAVNPDR